MDPLFVFLFTVIASTEGFLLVVILATLLLLQAKKAREAGIFIASTTVFIVLTNSLKEAFRIPRPDTALIEAAGYALPSGHAGGIMFLALCVSCMARNRSRRIRYTIYAIAAFLTLLIGWSRVALGVHTPLQVIAGYAIGALCAGFYSWYVSRRTQ